MKILDARTDEEFEQIHREYGGSSHAAALFDRGYSGLSSRWALYMHFKGKLDQQADLEENLRVRLGKATEHLHAEEVARRTGWTLKEGFALLEPERVPPASLNVRAFVVDKDKRIGATVDRYIVEHEQGPGILELKRRDYIQFIENYTEDDASIRDKIQLAHQFILHPDVTWGVIGVWYGAYDFKEYIYQREDLAEIMADLEAEWLKFWEQFDADDEPELTGGDLPAWLKVYDDELATVKEKLRFNDDTFDSIVETYQRNDGIAKEAKKLADDAKAKLVQLLDKRELASSNRFDIKATYVRNKGKTITAADVEKAGGEIQTRKAFTSVRLKVVDAVHVDTSKPSGKKEPLKPSHDALRRAEEFQRPLDGQQ